MIEVKDNGVSIALYGFDALGRRVTKTAAGFEYRLVHAGPWLIEDYRRLVGGNGNWYLKGGYVHGPGIDNVVMMRHRDWVDEDTDQDKIEPACFYFHSNRMGSVTELTAGDGNVVERYRYDEYGKPTVLDPSGIVLAGPVAGNPFLFTGREYDWETGLYHYRARAYDPATGTFLQEDPLGMADGVNVVAYVHADPVNLADPFGTSGVGEMIDSIINFISENRELFIGLLKDMMGGHGCTAARSAPRRGVVDGSTRCENRHVTNSKIDVKELSAEDRLNLIEQIWNTLEAEDVPVTEVQKAEIDRRIEEMDRDGERGIPWEVVLDQIRGRAK